MATNSSPPATTSEGKPPTKGTKPIVSGRRNPTAQFSVYIGLLVPMLALITAVPLAWGWGLSWIDIGLFLVFYGISGLGITVAYHRHFTHGSFKAKPWLRAALAIAGSTALQGPVTVWVADHRRHHAFADRLGDPHSPWLFGTTPWAIAKGFWHAHMGWNFSRDVSNIDRFAPDLVKDPLISRIDRLFLLWTLLSFAVPALLGGLITWSLWGAVTAFFWAGLVRVCVLHHVTWSVNSICHMLGTRPFTTRDKSANFWPLAIVSFGESWHNLHHADPTSARHGVQRGQIDISARVIWLFEKLGWAYDVRWPPRRRLNRLADRTSTARG
ncbi:stearoyl-CoA desaturase (delta-9 desaturase) [Amycolatopsis marina]|uniref:Stearoyl-CoA desaturase (Delta-9 desaturase) n=1 Tax=Amycolatopsis marina TaxID=490629 RepID=A0A1I1BWU4_9PSEU|nr:fatty acid desaturase [Amycolatopsis marina]SFB54751.1 stearoyl-CoA desaturase (delta-9 desaturase) [Amycolatopsis marina]